MERIPAYEGKQPYLFVSYAHKDSNAVLPVVSALFNEKYRVWYDEGIAPGSEWPKNIAVHLEKAEAVAVFVSERSLQSINCENEVVRAKEQGKKVFQYSVDGSVHPLLSDAETVGNAEALKALIDPKFIGDGTGYDRKLIRNRRSFISVALLALALLLVLGLGIGLIGLSAGWFDEYLPGRLPVVEEAMVPPETVRAAERIDSELLAKAVLEKLGREDLSREVTLSDEASLGVLKRALFRDENEGLTYYDLTTNYADYLYFERIDDELIALCKYFPNLRTLEAGEGTLSTLEPLEDCPYLEEVYLPAEAFPLKLPKDRLFVVKLK